jgi:uncharacterized protein (DUF1499 family)
VKLLTRLVLLAAVIALLMLLVAGPGTRLEFWEFRFGFTLMGWAVYVGLGAAGLALLLALVPKTRRGNAGVLVLAIVIGVATAAVPWSLREQARSLPRIHDITTDTHNPPEFVAVAPLRADAPNPVEYEGEDIARQQREAYPNIQPLETDVYPAIVFDHALATAETLGWEIVAAETDNGRIEATDTTFWFGFKDDVVIRIQGSNGGSIVDVRSKSRVGLSDVGANAARIRRFMDALDERLH